MKWEVGHWGHWGHTGMRGWMVVELPSAGTVTDFVEGWSKRLDRGRWDERHAVRTPSVSHYRR